MSLTVIGLVGAKGAGKSTFADAAVSRIPDVRQGALADKLKGVCSSVFFIPRLFFDDPKYKEQPLEVPVILTAKDVSSIFRAYGILPSVATSVDPHVNKVLTTPRQVAQYVGTEVLRSISPDVHCQSLAWGQPNYGTLIVTDLRFPDEVAFFRGIYGNYFRLVYVANQEAEMMASLDSHESESHLLGLRDGADFMVDNSWITEETFETIAEHTVKYIIRTPI